jgi:hypothetical protein
MSRTKNSKYGFTTLISVAASIFMLSAYAIAEHHEAGEPSIALEKPTYAPGEDIVVNYANGPGNKSDVLAGPVKLEISSDGGG